TAVTLTHHVSSGRREGREGRLTMCTRMTLKTPGDELGGLFVADISALVGAANEVLSYNIAPTDPVVVLRADEGVVERRSLASMRWGLVPHWAKNPSVGTRMLNARVVIVDAEAGIRDVFRNQRCLVVA